MMGKAQYL